MEKTELRRQIKKLAEENQDSIKKDSEKICKKILDLPLYKKSKILLAYMALKDEVGLEILIEDALKEKKKVYLPKIDLEKGQMDFYRFFNEERLCQGAYGILEPAKDKAFREELFRREEISAKRDEILVLVPGRAFSKKKDRMGRGKAYYDTYFTDLKDKVTLCGISFDWQLFEDIPCEEHDLKMDYVISPGEVLL